MADDDGLAGPNECPTVPLQQAPEQTAALMRCEGPNGAGPATAMELRLGFHSSADSFLNGGQHGVATALRVIEQQGLLGEWNGTIAPFWKGVSSFDNPGAVKAALELTQEARVNAVIGGGASSISVAAQYIFGLAGIPQVSSCGRAGRGGRPPRRGPGSPGRLLARIAELASRSASADWEAEVRAGRRPAPPGPGALHRREPPDEAGVRREVDAHARRGNGRFAFALVCRGWRAAQRAVDGGRPARHPGGEGRPAARRTDL